LTAGQLDQWIDRDLSLAASQGQLPPAFLVDELVEQAEEVLKANVGRSPVLIGPPGVGKTAILYELVRRAHEGRGVPLLRDSRVLQFSMRSIGARFKDRSEGATFFTELCTVLAHARPRIVPFFRDLHMAYALDWEAALGRYLATIDHPILAEAAPREFEQLVEYWSDLTQLLVAIPVSEPSPEQVKRLLARWAAHQESTNGRSFRPEAQRASVELTARFMGDRPFPRKALELLTTTADFLGEDGREPRSVGLREVVRRFSQLTRVPHRLVDPDEKLDLAEVHDFVTQRLLGQEEAVDAVVRMIALLKAGLADFRRPFGTFLFVGPTGVGKTFCAQLLADYLFGDPNRLVRLNLADYSEPYHVNLVFGDPHGNTPATQRGLLAQRLAGHPFGVLLLDEFEKANPKVHDAFLQLIDEGRYINGRSEVVSIASLIVIATSNAGAEVFRETGLGFDQGKSMRELDAELDRRLGRLFRFELLNRFDRVVHFHPLDRTEIRAIARRELAELAQRDGLTSRGIELEVDAEVLDWLVSHGYHPHYGARFLRREIERSVAGTLAQFVVRENPSRGSRVGLGVRGGRIDARFVRIGPPGDAPDPGRAGVGARGDTGHYVPLEPERLLEEARAWIGRWQPLLDESRLREAEAAQLMEQSSASGFWDDASKAQEVLRRYTVLDARLQSDRRLTRAIEELARALNHSLPPLDELAERVEQAALSYKRWIELGSDGDPSAAWVVLGPADSLTDCGDWLTDLVAMYRGWFRRKLLQYEVVAEEVDKGRPTRLVFEVEGPGVLKLLAMEQGEHRRRGAHGQMERALVEVVARRDGAPTQPDAVVEDARRGQGVAIPQRAARALLELPGRGLRLKFHGTNKETLALLLRDLAGALATPSGPVEIARTYGLRGGTVHDPRTSASTNNLKDVLRGNLEVFLRAWEVR
jgi:ATP-dependent Clp protease ATP-binding subunit ClpC